MQDLNLLLGDLVLQFKQHSSEEIALGMEKYMKHLFPFLGIKKPNRAALEAPFIAEAKKLTFPEIEFLAKSLWEMDSREFQYTAIVLLRASKIWKFKDSLHLLEWLLLHKSWWDSVDAIAAQMIGPYFLKFPEKRDEKIAEWKRSKNIWLNRTAIIFQIKNKNKTDVELLQNLILFFAKEKEFFIKKAIGWALRELSYTQPEFVITFCQNNTLQNLSKTEALKALKRRGLLE